MMMMMNTNSLGTSPTDSLTLGDGITQVTADTGSTILCSVKLTRFLTCCNYIPHVTTSSSDCPIVFIYKCRLFTDEGSCTLLKRLNYCFSVLASATN